MLVHQMLFSHQARPEVRSLVYLVFRPMEQMTPQLRGCKLVGKCLVSVLQMQLLRAQIMGGVYFVVKAFVGW